MTKKRPVKILQGYSGRLTSEQAAEGIRVARANAYALVIDARLLLDAERWSRASSLAILAIEEAGKIPLLRTLLVASTSEELKQTWREYRTHTAKNVQASILTRMTASPSLNDFRPMYQDIEAHAITDALKQLGFYTDCLGQVRWSLPEDVVTAEIAQHFVLVASFTAKPESNAMESQAELSLWAKHLGPVWGRKDYREMKEALLACFREAAATGVLSGNVSPEQMESFMS